MTGSSPGDPRTRSVRQRIEGILERYPELAAVGLYTLVTIAATVAAYFAIFTIFADYDDEGTLLVTVQAFANGEVLYRDVWSVYGPFYYEVFGGLFSLTGLDVSTDAGRTIVIVVWVLASLLFGLAAQRLSRSLWIGVTGMIATFAALLVLANEPMHPQGLCVLLLGAFALLAATAPSKGAGVVGGGCGMLLAALVLTKVNLGVFAVAAVVLAAALTVEPLARRAWVRWPVIAAFLAMPTVILARDLDLAWAREFALLVTLAMITLLVAAGPLRPNGYDRPLGRWLLGGIAGFAAAFVAIVAILLPAGPSLAETYDGIVTQSLGIRDLQLYPAPFPAGAALDWAIAAIVGAVLVSRILRSGDGQPSIWSGLLRALVGVLIWLSVAHIVPFFLNPSSANPVVIPMLLAWVALVPPGGVSESAHKRFLRVLFPALAVAETLQIYPVPGSQLGIAAVAFVPVGAICLGDAMVELRATAAGRWSLDRLASITTVVSVALAGMFALNAIVLPAASNIVLYQEEPELPFPGAGLVHLPEPAVETYAQLVDLLQRNECSTFIGYPGMNSFYLWAGLKPPVTQPPNSWLYGLTIAQQQRVVDDLRASPRPCAIRNEELAERYLRDEPPPDRPLVKYIFEDFRPAAQVGAFQFLLPKPSATGR